MTPQGVEAAVKDVTPQDSVYTIKNRVSPLTESTDWTKGIGSERT
jgi:hypothetical protein